MGGGGRYPGITVRHVDIVKIAHADSRQASPDRMRRGLDQPTVVRREIRPATAALCKLLGPEGGRVHLTTQCNGNLLERLQPRDYRSRGERALPEGAGGEGGLGGHGGTDAPGEGRSKGLAGEQRSTGHGERER